MDVPGTFVDEAELLALRGLAARPRDAARDGSDRAGRFASRRRGRGLDIDDVRPWAAGDDLRHLDRNSTARTGAPHVRRFRDERERTALLLADFRPNMIFGTRNGFRSVAAARALGIVGWSLAASGWRLGLLASGALGTSYTAPRSGAAAMPAVAGALAHAHALSSTAELDDQPLAPLFDTAQRLVPRGGLVVMASAFDCAGDGVASALLALRQRADLSAILVLDAFEQAPLRGAYPFAVGAGRPLWGRIPARPPDAAAERRRMLQAAGVTPIEVSAADPLPLLAAALQAADVG